MSGLLSVRYQRPIEGQLTIRHHWPTIAGPLPANVRLAINGNKTFTVNRH